MFYRTLRILRDIIEVYIPVASFIVMFCAFIIQIFFRYVLHDPLTWPFELTTVGFVWTVVLGGIHAMRTRSHIAFGIVYDLMSLRWQRISRISSNIFISVGFGIALYPCYKFVAFMKMKQTPDFQIPFNIVYAPFVVFCAFVIAYALIDLWQDIRPGYRGVEEQVQEASRT